MPGMTQAGYTPPKAELKKTPKAQPPKKKKKRKKKKGMNGAAAASLMIMLIAAAIGAGTIFVYTQTQPYLQTFAPGTMLMGYPLGGATPEEAHKLVDKIEAEHLKGWQAEIVCMNQTYTLTSDDVSLAIDREATLEPLWAAAREGGMFERYMDMLRMQREPEIVNPVLAYDLTPLDAILEIIRADVECGSIDATVYFRPGDAQPFVFTDEEPGYALDTAHVKSDIEKELIRLNPVSVTLEPRVIEPKVYRAVLENALSLRGHLTVALEGDEAAVANAVLAAKPLNGLCVEPGETLSFNETVGARTQALGYQTALEPAYGENIFGVGGGVCQVSTALYRAALLGGIDVIERNAAVRPVDYCPMGQEAAVSGQGLDLKLSNQTDAKLFISTRVYQQEKQQMLEIMLIGEELGRRYALESTVQELEMIEEPVYVRDREGKYAVYTDERVPVSDALPGYTARVERVTLDGDAQQTARETIDETTYDPAAPMIYVGVKERNE
ncbi:MAG: VanW family protein [Clostridia bacterium]|nr:VanW family protein [Clostridia bacterium]